MGEGLGILAGYMCGNSPPGFLVNNENNAGIKGNYCAKFVGNKIDGVAEVQRRTDGLSDLM
jgi:hypothetical protein